LGEDPRKKKIEAEDTGDNKNKKEQVRRRKIADPGNFKIK
jgi:hypothetical protein